MMTGNRTGLDGKGCRGRVCGAPLLMILCKSHCVFK